VTGQGPGAEAAVTGPAGWTADTEVLCPARPSRHVMASVYRGAGGELFIDGFVLSGDTPGRVRCKACRRTYLVDPAAVRRAVHEGNTRYSLPRTGALRR